MHACTYYIWHNDIIGDPGRPRIRMEDGEWKIRIGMWMRCGGVVCLDVCAVNLPELNHDYLRAS